MPLRVKATQVKSGDGSRSTAVVSGRTPRRPCEWPRNTPLRFINVYAINPLLHIGHYSVRMAKISILK